MGAAVDDVALVAGEEVEIDVTEGAVGAPVRLLDVVPVRVRPEVLPAAVVAGALDVRDGVGGVLWGWREVDSTSVYINDNPTQLQGHQHPLKKLDC